MATATARAGRSTTSGRSTGRRSHASTRGIATGDATFETTVPSWEDWDASHLRGAPPRRGRRDGASSAGSAVSPVSDRCVYGGVVENSVYVAEDARGQGVGRRCSSGLSLDRGGGYLDDPDRHLPREHGEPAGPRAGWLRVVGRRRSSASWRVSGATSYCSSAERDRRLTESEAPRGAGYSIDRGTREGSPGRLWLVAGAIGLSAAGDFVALVALVLEANETQTTGVGVAAVFIALMGAGGRARGGMSV